MRRSQLDLRLSINDTIYLLDDRERAFHCHNTYV